MDYDWGPNPRLPPPPNRSHSVPVWYLINSKPSCGACKTGVSSVIIMFLWVVSVFTWSSVLSALFFDATFNSLGLLTFFDKIGPKK